MSVYVKQVVRDTLRVEFFSASFAVTFQTRFVVQQQLVMLMLQTKE